MLAKLGVGLGLFYIVAILAGFVGWVINIIDIVNSVSGPLTTLLVLRIVGIFAFPLGAILGLFF